MDLSKLTPELINAYGAKFGALYDEFEKETGLPAAPMAIYLAARVASVSIPLNTAIRVFVGTYTGNDPSEIQVQDRPPAEGCQDPTCECNKKQVLN